MTYLDRLHAKSASFVSDGRARDPLGDYYRGWRLRIYRVLGKRWNRIAGADPAIGIEATNRKNGRRTEERVILISPKSQQDLTTRLQRGEI